MREVNLMSAKISTTREITASTMTAKRSCARGPGEMGCVRACAQRWREILRGTTVAGRRGQVFVSFCLALNKAPNYSYLKGSVRSSSCCASFRLGHPTPPRLSWPASSSRQCRLRCYSTHTSIGSDCVPQVLAIRGFGYFVSDLGAIWT